MEWIYRDSIVPDKKPTFYGFVYLIEYTDSTMYVGQKKFYSKKTLTPLKSGVQREGGTFFNKIINHKVTKMEYVISESDWRTYNGSSKKTKSLKIKKKTILQVYEDSINLTLGEVEWIIRLDAIRNDMYHNENILGKFHRGRVKKEIR